VPNLLEYAFGFDPYSPSPAEDAVWLNGSSSDLRFAFRRGAGVSDVTYLLQYSTNMLGGAWSESVVSPTLVGTLPDGAEAVEVAPPVADANQLFMRLKVRK